MPSVYWPAGQRPGYFIPVDDLLYDLLVCKEWACPPWETSGRNPEEWRNVYRYLYSFNNEVIAELDWEKNRTGKSVQPRQPQTKNGKPLFKPREPKPGRNS